MEIYTFTPEEKQRYVELAKAAGKPLSPWLRSKIEEALAEKRPSNRVQKDYEALQAKGGTVEDKIWITYAEEGIRKLEEDYKTRVPIAGRVSELADRYRESLYQ